MKRTATQINTARNATRRPVTKGRPLRRTAAQIEAARKATVKPVAPLAVARVFCYIAAGVLAVVVTIAIAISV